MGNQAEYGQTKWSQVTISMQWLVSQPLSCLKTQSLNKTISGW